MDIPLRQMQHQQRKKEEMNIDLVIQKLDRRLTVLNTIDVESVHCPIEGFAVETRGKTSVISCSFETGPARFQALCCWC